jgi:hypothetical protein
VLWRGRFRRSLDHSKNGCRLIFQHGGDEVMIPIVDSSGFQEGSLAVAQLVQASSCPTMWRDPSWPGLPDRGILITAKRVGELFHARA